MEGGQLQLGARLPHPAVVRTVEPERSGKRPSSAVDPGHRHAEQPDGANFGGHYIPPMQELENDQLVTPNAAPNNPIFVTGKVYHPRDA